MIKHVTLYYKTSIIHSLQQMALFTKCLVNMIIKNYKRKFISSKDDGQPNNLFENSGFTNNSTNIKPKQFNYHQTSK